MIKFVQGETWDQFLIGLQNLFPESRPGVLDFFNNFLLDPYNLAALPFTARLSFFISKSSRITQHKEKAEFNGAQNILAGEKEKKERFLV